MTSHLASISAKVSVHVHFAMHFGANIDIQEKTGWTPLMIASKNGHAGIASLLVQHGANLDLQETTGFGFELTDVPSVSSKPNPVVCCTLITWRKTPHVEVTSVQPLCAFQQSGS